MVTLQELGPASGRLATLSACETGIVGADLPDEAASLPSALLQAGFCGVAASLWSVADISTAMLMGALKENCRHRPVQYLNNVLEQDHRAIKRRIRASQNFRSFWGTWRTIAGYEAIRMIRKGQAYGSAPAARGGLLHCFILGLFSAVTV